MRIKSFDKEVARVGLQQALRNFIDCSHTKVIVITNNDQTRNILHNSPVIVVSNHPHIYESIALFASLPRREDIYLYH